MRGNALTISGGLSALVLCVAIGLCSGVGAQPPATLAIRNVTVIAGGVEPPLEHTTVLVRGDRIAAVSPDRAANLPANVRIIDGTGRYLVPGLFEMHAHISKTRSSALGLFVVNGVTTMRDMGGDHEELLRWRREVRSGVRIGPRILLAGPYLESARNVERMRKTPPEEMVEPVERTRIPVGSPEDARRVVASLARSEVDHVKIRTVQDRETYMAIAAAARAHKLPLVGHASGITPEDILAAGQKSIEHGLFPTLDEMSSDARRALFRRFAAAGIGVVPTMVTVPKSILAPDDVLRAIVDDAEGKLDLRRRYLSRFLILDWKEQVLEQTAERRAQVRQIAPSLIRNLREMREAGVRIMAGSDVGVLNIFPGSSLHEELELFVNELGMTPAQALECATIRPADFLGLADSVGTVSAGKVADLVLLDANPLEDIRNLRQIRAVILRGRLFDRAGLDKLLSDVGAAEDQRVNDWPRNR